MTPATRWGNSLDNSIQWDNSISRDNFSLLKLASSLTRQACTSSKPAWTGQALVKHWSKDRAGGLLDPPLTPLRRQSVSGQSPPGINGGVGGGNVLVLLRGSHGSTDPVVADRGAWRPALDSLRTAALGLARPSAAKSEASGRWAGLGLQATNR